MIRKCTHPQTGSIDSLLSADNLTERAADNLIERLADNLTAGKYGEVQERLKLDKNKWMRERYHRITCRWNCLEECNTLSRPLVGSPYQITT